MGALRYSSAFVSTALTGGLSSVTPGTTGSVQVGSVTGLPSQYPYTLVIGYQTASQEVVTVTQAPTGGGPFTFANCVRGDDGSAAPLHLAGETVVHGVSARDFSNLIPVVNVLTYGADPSGASFSDTAIANAIAAASAGDRVYMPCQGIYKISKPIVMQKAGVTLEGGHGATASGDDAGSFVGSVIRVASSFTNPAWSGFATAAVLLLDGTPGTGGSTVQGMRLRNFWVDGTSAPAGVDGVALYGPANAVQIDHVGAFKATGNGFALYTDSATPPDGTHFLSCLAQTCGGHGFTGKFTDADFIGCHAQTCGTSGTGSGFNITGGNNQLSICRSDLNGEHGYVIDHPGGDGYDDYNLLTGCTTQRNAKNGLLVTNSSATGTTYRMPVKLAGCAFTGDGTAGVSFAGARVEGANLAEFSGCSVRVYTIDVAGGCPSIGLKTATIGSGPGSPTAITWSGGHINAQTTIVDDAAAVQGNLRISPDTLGSLTYEPASTVARQGSATLASGTVTVSNSWVTSSARIMISVISKGSSTAVGVPQVSARSAGSFTITSYIPGGVATQTGDLSVIAWQIVSQ